MQPIDRRHKLTRGMIVAITGLALAVGGTVAAAPASASPPQHTVYTAPSGKGSTCSASRPCSLEKAKDHARALASKGRVVTVVANDGTYRLASPLKFSAADGGTRKGSVSWRAAEGANPVFTGAVGITGWSLADSANGVYSARVDSKFRTRQLYVNGRLAERARLEIPESSFTTTATGITINDSALAEKLAQIDPSGVDFSAAQSFTDRFAPVKRIAGNVVEMQQPAWDNNTYGYDTIQYPFRKYEYAFENSRAFLTEPGQWFLDAKAKRLYYKPLPGEDITTAAVELPRLENLLQISGTHKKPVSDLSFSGITFSGTSWLGPNSSSGFASQQTGAYIAGVQKDRPADAFQSCAVGCAGFEATRGTWSQMPGAVQVSAARNVTFANNTFRNLGSNALGIGNDGGANASKVDLGAQGISVVGNFFTQNAGAAANIGGTQKDAHHPSKVAYTNKDITVENNLITESALVYRDQSAIFASYVDGLNVSHNEISAMPYTGIGIGYGWGLWDAGGSPDYQTRGTYKYYPVYSTPTTAKNNVVEANYIHDVMEVMSDGACVYTLSDLPGSRIDRNYCSNANDEYGIYHDEASRHISSTDNVMADVRAYFHINGQNGNLVNNLVNTRTYSTTTAADFPQGRDISVVDPISIATGFTAAATTIAYQAGREEAYRSTVDPERSPLAIDVTSSESSPAPGETLTVAAALTNVDPTRGLAISAASLEVPEGWTATPAGSAPGSLAGGASAKIEWSVEVPSDLTSALPASLGVTLTSGVDDVAFSDSRTVVVTPDVPDAPPITESLSTFTNTGATFAQDDGTYSVTGAGVDMFEGYGTVADDYGAVFTPSSVDSRSIVSARVVSFDSPANNSKAALVLKNDFTKPGESTGYVSLAVQKDGGVTLFSDGNGDGYLENYQPSGGSPKEGPVYLRLVRDGGTVTGSWSLDGRSWTQVGSSVQLSTPDAALDAGFAYVSAVPGTSGTASFDQFRIVNG